MKTIDTYRPKWAPHVQGQIGERDDEGEQLVLLTCDLCRDASRKVCRSAMPRQHVASYARAHLHRDALAVSKKP
jgi:hypothetical protein